MERASFFLIRLIDWCMYVCIPLIIIIIVIIVIVVFIFIVVFILIGRYISIVLSRYSVSRERERWGVGMGGRVWRVSGLIWLRGSRRG